MASLAMFAARVENNENIDEFTDNRRTTASNKRNMHTSTKTMKYRRQPSAAINSILNEISVDPIPAMKEDIYEDDTETYGNNFQNAPISAGVERTKGKDTTTQLEGFTDADEYVPSSIVSKKTEIKPYAEKHQNVMFKEDTPEYHYNNPYKAPPQQEQRQQALETTPSIYKKLDYIINLLESIYDDEITNATEDVIMYSFLGIFIIFVVDSFTRVGKYTR